MRSSARNTRALEKYATGKHTIPFPYDKSLPTALMMFEIMQTEFDRQIQNLLDKSYPKLAGLSVASFLKHVEPLSRLVPASRKTKSGIIPFLIVVKNELVNSEAAMKKTVVKSAKGSVNMTPVSPKDFSPIADLKIPNSPVYLLLNVTTGHDTLNMRPEDALKKIKKVKRYPLTIDEGIALLTHFPETLTDKTQYNSFQMSGSRRSDQRIPSIWMSYGKPRLGWCWDRNPHTWLGSASCSKRVSI